ncbi:Predicted protein [Taphrina deformans PYCC 5710]|uniref:Indole-diterpene biosynthesis protein PaxU n=1 Tax=Taphrina deformans (strain PYCC 5710 / ATCC 11124 / CBS 356.35 / IMI 108563 / JCM 9778 / NBRC 8474) TaxID=1097556 RepID=R4XPR3_TAPDE|nr:Predicted protein [Taphrina deformans PYCC 5710]|eukprot:CCG85166.1 Predicted protein [Taphrina deformans PYCC 5710]
MSSMKLGQQRLEDARPRSKELAFTALSQRFHFTPATALTTPHDPKHPKLILLFGWLGARLRHVQKYAIGYNKLYPSSPIIIVRSFPSDMRPLSKFGREFSALTVLLQLHNIDLTKSGNDVLLQSFSNGGCWSLSALMNRMDPYAVIRPRTVIFDSCPGRAKYIVFIRAFISAGNLGILGQAFWTPLITLVYFTWKFYCRIRGKDPFGERRREMLHKVCGQRRLYLYSRKDDLISHNDILHHANQVTEFHAGQEEVMTEEFVGSEHVAHMRLDEARYWRLVQHAWDPDSAGREVVQETGIEEEGKAQDEVVTAEVHAAEAAIGIAAGAAA